jgi:hypothetical protein
MRYLILLSVLFVAACNTVVYPTQSELNGQDADPNLVTQSLFGDGTIPEQDIQRLLNGKIVIHDSMKVAIYKFDPGPANFYSVYGYDNYTNFKYNEEYLKTQQRFIDTLSALVKQSPKVQEVVLMPSLMVSRNPNISQLREAAVRLQADMLLIFSVTSDIYYKYKFLARNNAKAFVNSEVLLMDIRTGVIPYSNVITDDVLVTKEGEEVIDETRKRALAMASLKALIAGGKGVKQFLH